MDVLTKLNFFDDDLARENQRNLYAFLQNSKQNIIIKSDLEQQQEVQDDIQRNLFQVCCAISGLQTSQKTQNLLDDKLLLCYLDSINFHRDDQDLVLIDQLSVVKSIINRKQFALTA